MYVSTYINNIPFLSIHLKSSLLDLTLITRQKDNGFLEEYIIAYPTFQNMIIPFETNFRLFKELMYIFHSFPSKAKEVGC